MVCIFFVQFHPKERTDTVLAARTRAELDDHLDLLLENSHHLGMHWFEAERFELDWGVFGRPKTDALSSALFYVQDFLDVSPAADGRVWVAHHQGFADRLYNGKFEVFSDPESITSSEVDVYEVYVIGTQHTKSALKT